MPPRTVAPLFQNVMVASWHAFTGCLPDIVFDQYIRLGIGRKTATKTWNYSFVTSFFLEILAMVSCTFCEK